MSVRIAFLLLLATPAFAQEPPLKPAIAESPGIRVLKGLTVPEFEQEMQMMVQALGVNCGFCHVRNNFAAETNEKKVVARRMLEMTKLINSQFFPDYIPLDGESKLGKVTCSTCHQGETKPKTQRLLAR
jgi:photosynthetic reaction center cytochrome c subunit